MEVLLGTSAIPSVFSIAMFDYPNVFFMALQRSCIADVVPKRIEEQIPTEIVLGLCSIFCLAYILTLFRPKSPMSSALRGHSVF